MTMTTIKVDVAVRDRLKAQAARAHRTLGEHLAVLAALDDRQERLNGLRAAVRGASTEARASHAAETAGWECSERVDLGRDEALYESIQDSDSRS